MSPESGYITASDGLPARVAGEWGTKKLEFLTQFGPPALDATKTKLTRCYIDMFAGPGVNIGRTTREEFLGSPLSALDLVGPQTGTAFTDAFLVNESRTGHEALTTRIDRLYSSAPRATSRDRVRTILGDVNTEITGILDEIHPKAYLYVFADPDNPTDLPWRSIEALKRHGGHSSVDLYVLFPLGMALRRLVDYTGPVTPANARVLTEFYGSDEWRECERFRQSDALRHDFGRCLEQVYINRLRTLWTHADHICPVKRGSGHHLYTMLFASNSDAGKKISAWAKRSARKADRTGQVDLDLGGD